MALDPRIALAVTPVQNSGQTLTNGLISGFNAGQQPERAALQNRLLQQRGDIQEAAIANNAEDRKRLEVLGTMKALRNMDPARREELAPSLQQSLKDRGFMGADDDFLDDPYMDDAWLDANIAALEGGGRRGVGVDQQNFEARMRAAGIDPGSDDYIRAARISAGLDPRAGTSAAERIATTPGMTETVAGSEAVIAGRKAGAAETERLLSQLELEPQVAAAVRDSVMAVEDQYEVEQKKRDNTRALAVYDAAMNGLVVGLGGTVTGPGVSWLPALTADAQVAEGAIASVAPVLKQLFRTAGEGNFTDSDQKILMAMVPTRDDLPEARVQKFRTIDAIVRAKLLGDLPEIVRNPTQEQFDALPSGAVYIWNWEAKRKP